MNSKRLFFLLIAAVVVMCGLLVGGAYFADQTLQKLSKDIVDKRSQISNLEAQQSSLAVAKSDIERYQELAEIAENIVPQDKDQAQTVREIVNIAAAHGIRLGSITFPSSNLGEIKVPSPSTGGSSTPSAPSSKSSTLSQLAPVKDISGVYSLQIVIESDASVPVSYNRFIDFLDDLEHNRRTALVSSVNISPDSRNRGALTFTLTLDEYVKP